MSLGCPVVEARALSITEITGDAELYFDRFFIDFNSSI
jgi:hypothetical protein